MKQICISIKQRAAYDLYKFKNSYLLHTLSVRQPVSQSTHRHMHWERSVPLLLYDNVGCIAFVFDHALFIKNHFVFAAVFPFVVFCALFPSYVVSVNISAVWLNIYYFFCGGKFVKRARSKGNGFLVLLFYFIFSRVSVFPFFSRFETSKTAFVWKYILKHSRRAATKLAQWIFHTKHTHIPNETHTLLLNGNKQRNEEGKSSKKNRVKREIQNKLNATRKHKSLAYISTLDIHV